MRLCKLLMIGLGLVGTGVLAQKANPFEAIPEPPQELRPAVLGPTIKAIEFRGVKRFSPFVLSRVIASRAGSAYDLEALQRDTEALYKTKLFSYVVWETEPSAAGAIVRFVVVERPLIESIDVQGDTVTMPEVLERWSQRKIKLRAEALYDEDELPRATLAIQELVSERGRQNLTVTPLVERLGPPSRVKITFRVTQK